MKVFCIQCGTAHSIPAPVPPGVRYRCARCYATLPVETDSSDPDTELRGLKPRLAEIERRLSALEHHVLASTEVDARELEVQPVPADTAGIQPTEPPVEEELMGEEKAEPIAVPRSQPRERQFGGGTFGPRAEVRRRETPQRAFQSIQPPPRRPELSGSTTAPKDWEQALPGNWLSRIGAVALFIGLGFLAKMAYDRDWIGPVLQLLLGLLLGGALLWAGHHWSKRYRVWAQALTGVGVAVLYLSLFGSYALNDLMGFFPTFVLMFLVTAGAAFLALRQESMAIAIIGIIGAFLVPVILGASDYSSSGAGSGQTNPGLLIAYILVLDAGIVWLATFRNWRWFVLLGLVGSLAVYGMWYATSGSEGSRLVAHGALTGIFVFFVAATTLFHLLWKRSPQPTDLALMSLNAAAYFGISFHLLWDDHRGWLGLFSFLLAGLYGVLAYVAQRLSPENRRLSIFAVGIALVFLTVAIPIQLQRAWITVAWAAEGAILIWIASREGIRQLQVWGLLVLGLVFIRLFAFESTVAQEDFRPILNSMFLPFAMSIIAFYAAAYYLKKDRDVLHPWLFPAMALAANFLTLWLFSAEIVNFAGSRIIAAAADNAGLSEIRGLENARNVALLALWCAYGFGLVTAGLRRGWTWLRVPGYSLLLIAAGATLVTLNYSHALIESTTSKPLINYSFAAFAVCTAAFYLCVYTMRNNCRRLYDDETLLFPALILGASFLTLWALSSEIVTFAGDPEAGTNARYLILALLWAGYALGLLVIGVSKGWGWLRGAGYLLILIACATTLFSLNYSTAMIQREASTPLFNYSFGAFALMTAALYLCAYVLARNSRKVGRDEMMLLPALLIGANFLTLWAVSSEILTFVGSGHGRNMGLTMLWAAYGTGLIAAGIAGRWRWVRVGGLGLVSIAIVKLFLYDTFTLDSGYRVAAYLSLGVLLLIGGFVYHKYADAIKEFIFEQPPRGSDSTRDQGHS